MAAGLFYYIRGILLSWFLFIMSSNADAFAASAGGGGGEVPQLPAPDENANLPTIKLGETIRFEEMGPIILNTDGSTRRIDNWDTLTEHEKEVTWRRISKRNEQRRQKLLAQQQEQEAAQKQQSDNDDEANKDL